MMKCTNKIVGLLLLLAVSTGCREKIPEIYNPFDKSYYTSWGDVFRSYWNGMNNNYTFWDIDSTDWDAVYTKYSPIFDTINFEEPYGRILAHQYFTEVSSTLIDHHFKLSFPGFAGMGGISPGSDEVKRRDYYHDLLSYDQYLRVFRKNSSRITSAELMVLGSGSTVSFFAMSYLLDNQIAYLRFNEFQLYENLRSKNSEISQRMRKVLENYIQLVYNTRALKGIIIDTRSNPGGSLEDLTFAAGVLVGKKHRFADIRTKNGLGRLDHSPWVPIYVSPQREGVVCPDVPIVSLTDIHSASMSELTPMAIRSLPRGIVIGERTYGAMGPLVANPIYLSGQFENKFIKVYTSSLATRTLKGEFLEGIGITPDIEVKYDGSSFDNGIDNQLERAVRYINTGN